MLIAHRNVVRRRSFALIICAALQGIACSVLAAPGELDLGFGDGGVATVAFNTSDGAESVVIQRDGKIVVAGTSATPVGGDIVFALMRCHADGSLDTGFNGTGRVTTAVGTGGSYGHSAAIQDDGRIIVVGSINRAGGEGDFALARYNPNGDLDTSFNATGIVVTAIGSGNDSASAVALQSNGKVVVAGVSESGANFDFALARYNSDGSLDITFNGTGVVTAAIGSGRDVASSLAIQADGKIVVAGTSAAAGTYANDFALARFHPDGTADTTFNGTGKIVTDVAGGADGCESVVLQSDGKIVAAGYAFNPFEPGNDQFALVRYHPDGTRDTSFGDDGKVITSIGSGLDRAWSAAIQLDGKIVVAGNSAPNRIALVRYDTNGRLDTTFNGSGMVTGTMGSGYSAAADVALQRDGKVVLAGHHGLSNGEAVFAVMRYNGDPHPQIAVEHPAGITLSDDMVPLIDFGSVATGASVNRVLTIRNIGEADLENLTMTVSGGSAAVDYSVLDPGPVHLTPGAAMAVEVFFLPGGPGARITTLTIARGSGDRYPFVIHLTGTRATPQLDAWRQAYFGSTANSGAGADLSDPDRDGVVNLMEFAAGTGPWTQNAQPGQLVKNGSSLEFTWPRRKAALAEISYEVEWSESLSGPWSAAGVSTVIFTDGSVMQEMKSTLPAGGSGRRFVRLRVARL